jgi:formate-nitrite transporter family protein
VGTFLFALCIAHVAIFNDRVQESLLQTGMEHLGSGFGVVFVRAIFAGWLIALMVWLLPGAEHSRLAIIIIITYLIGLGRFNHIVAGSTTMFFVVVTHHASWGAYFLHFFLPTIFGNILGGVSLVAALGHAQVAGVKTNK